MFFSYAMKNIFFITQLSFYFNLNDYYARMRFTPNISPDTMVYTLKYYKHKNSGVFSMFREFKNISLLLLLSFGFSGAGVAMAPAGGDVGAIIAAIGGQVAQANQAADRLRGEIANVGALTYQAIQRVNNVAAVREGEVDRAGNRAVQRVEDQRAAFEGRYRQADAAIQGIANGCNQQLNRALDDLAPRLRQEAVTNAEAIERRKIAIQIAGAHERAAAEELGRLEARQDPRARAALEADNRAKQQTAVAVEEAKVRLGVYDKQNEAAIKMNDTKWTSIQNMFSRLGQGLSNPKTMAKVALGVALCCASYYVIKHGVPIVMAKLTQPKMVSDTSIRSWFGSTTPKKGLDLDRLRYEGDLKEQLDSVIQDMNSAIEHGEKLPTVLLYGPPGTGKTAFAKALAYKFNALKKQNKITKKVDYVLTSGSEFAKVAAKDLNLAIKYLRDLLVWSKSSNSIVILFFDEVEGICAERTLPDTPKYVENFVLSWLSMLDTKSQKNICLLLGSNNPHKIDKAIMNRVAKRIEFKLPSASLCGQIFEDYLSDYIKANPKDKKPEVTLEPGLKAKLKDQGPNLVGLNPRSIDFIAEELAKSARRTSNKVMTTALVDKIVQKQKLEAKLAEQWEQERQAFIKQQMAVGGRG